MSGRYGAQCSSFLSFSLHLSDTAKMVVKAPTHGVSRSSSYTIVLTITVYGREHKLDNTCVVERYHVRGGVLFSRSVASISRSRYKDRDIEEYRSTVRNEGKNISKTPLGDTPKI